MLTISRVFSFSERALRGSVDHSDVNWPCSQHVCMRPLPVAIFCTFLWSSDSLDVWMLTLIQSVSKKKKGLACLVSLGVLFSLCAAGGASCCRAAQGWESQLVTCCVPGKTAWQSGGTTTTPRRSTLCLSTQHLCLPRMRCMTKSTRAAVSTNAQPMKAGYNHMVTSTCSSFGKSLSFQKP